MNTNLFSLRKRVSSAHLYHQPNWSQELNEKNFGACYSEHGHGHNYEFEFAWSLPSGLIQSISAMSIFEERAKITIKSIADLYDHQHISFTHPSFKIGGEIPTTENIARQVWREFQKQWHVGGNSPSKIQRSRFDGEVLPSGVTVWEMQDLAANVGQTPMSHFRQIKKCIAAQINLQLGNQAVPYSIQIQTDFIKSTPQVVASFAIERSRQAESLSNLANLLAEEIQAPVLLRDANYQSALSAFG
jgi:6-pyruvoyltetrahydropterin/6-carboxytetrahydropterin synthase